jgi:hypothetical protein
MNWLDNYNGDPKKKQPITVYDKKDPRLLAYNDSLILHNTFKNSHEKFKSMTPNEWYDDVDSFSKTDANKKAYSAYSRLIKKNPNYTFESEIGDGQGNTSREYKKPTQPVVYKQKPKGTLLSNKEEISYNKWKSTLPENLQYEDDYDLRGFWKENPTWTPENQDVHMTDKFKLPNHPTFSVESQYYEPGMKAGYWEGEEYVPFEQLSKGKTTSRQSGWKLDGTFTNIDGNNVPNVTRKMIYKKIPAKYSTDRRKHNLYDLQSKEGRFEINNEELSIKPIFTNQYNNTMDVLNMLKTEYPMGPPSFDQKPDYADGYRGMGQEQQPQPKKLPKMEFAYGGWLNNYE